MFFKKYLQISLYILYAQRNDGLKVTYIKKVFSTIFFSYRKYRGLNAKAWKPSTVGVTGRLERGFHFERAGSLTGATRGPDHHPPVPTAQTDSGPGRVSSCNPAQAPEGEAPNASQLRWPGWLQTLGRGQKRSLSSRRSSWEAPTALSILDAANV